MAETPRLDLPYLSASQYQKEIFHNIALDRLDLLVQCAVLDRNLTTPPASPVLGDAYIVAATGTGAWASHDNHLALWISSQWEFIAPLPGFTCWVTDETVLVYWSGAAWVIASGGGGSTTFLGLSDTPDSYSGQAGKAVLVNAGGTALEFGASGGGAPVDATYIVSSSHGTLTAERVLTNSPSVTWNTGTAGQVSADIPAGAVTLAQLAPLAFPSLLGRGNPPTGAVEAVTVGAGLQLTSGTLSLLAAPGASDFLGLTDTPDSYSGQAGKAVVVNAGATALEFGTVSGGGGAPTDAEYIVGSASTPLTQARVLTTTPTVSWDLTTAGQAKAVVPDASITEAKLLLADNTTQNVSSTRHGLVPKAPNVATQFLDGTGAWSTPAGGMTTEQVQDTVGAMVVGSTSVAFTYNDAVGTLNVSLQPGGVDESHINLTDVMLDDASIFKHGFAPKLSGNAAHYLNGNGGWTTPASGATTFLALTDTPDTYAANALKILRVNAGATATEFGPVLGTLSTQNASAVAITGGAMSIGGHAPTGVLDVQGSVVASDLANQYLGVRLWPVAPAGALSHQALRLEPATGSAVATSGFYGLVVTDQPVTSGNSMALYLLMAAGAGRYNVYAQGSASNYFAGNVGIGNATPSHPLDVTGGARFTGNVGVGAAPYGNTKLAIEQDKTSSLGIVIQNRINDAGGFATMQFFNTALATVGSINANATSTSYNTSSDIRLKHAIAPLTGSLDVIAALNPISHRWNVDDSYAENFLAHELQHVLAYAVTGEPDAVNEDGSIKPQQVDASKIVPRIVGALKELLARVTTLEQALA